MTVTSSFRCYCILGAWICADPRAIADEDKASQADTPAERVIEEQVTRTRTIYLSKYAAAQDLVVLLHKHFEDDPSIRLVAEPNSGLLSIRATTPDQLNEVLKLLATIDQPRRQITIQLLIVDFSKQADNNQIEKLAAELTGSAEAVIATLNREISSGQVAAVKKYRLPATENRVSELVCGEHRPMVSGFTANATTGVETPVVVARALGTTIQIKPRIEESGKIQIDLTLKDSRIVQADEGIENAKGADGPTVSRGVSEKRLQTPLTVANGGSVVATTWMRNVRDGQAPTMIVVSAAVVDPNNPPKPTLGLAVPPMADAAPAKPGIAPPQVQPVRRFGPVNDGTPYRMARDPELLNDLKLSDEQKQKFSDLNREWSNGWRAIARGGKSPEALQPLIRDFEQRYKGVLTEEQQQIWNTRQDEIKRANPLPPARRSTKTEPGAI